MEANCVKNIVYVGTVSGSVPDDCFIENHRDEKGECSHAFIYGVYGGTI